MELFSHSHQHPDLASNSSSSVAGNSSSHGSHPLEPYIYIPLSGVNAILSAYSLAFFSRSAAATAVHPVLRRLLVALSGFEVLFHCSVICFYARVATLERGEKLLGLPGAGAAGSGVQLCLLRLSLTMRNWTMNFLSWSRVEAVFRPLAARSHSLFQLSNLIAMETGAGLVGLAVSVAMVTAHDAGKLSGWRLHTVEVIFYTYQGLLPVVSIFAATCITVCVLRRASLERRRMASAAAPLARRESQAIRITVAMSVSCLILEGPTDLCGFVRSKTPVTELIVNTLVEIDSLFNFILLACTTDMCGGGSGGGGRGRNNPASAASLRRCHNVLHAHAARGQTLPADQSQRQQQRDRRRNVGAVTFV